MYGFITWLGASKVHFTIKHSTNSAYSITSPERVHRLPPSLPTLYPSPFIPCDIQLSCVRADISLEMPRHYRRHQWRAEIIFAADLFPSICRLSLAILQYFGRRATCECRGHSSPHTSLLMLLLSSSLQRREWSKLNQWRHLRSNNRSFSDRNWVKLKSTFLINRLNIGWFHMLYL